MEREMPTRDKAIGVNTCEETREVLIVDLRCWVGIKVSLFQEVDELENISFGEVVWKGNGNDLVEEFGDAIQHRSKWGCEETDNWTAREKLLLAFG